MVREIVRVRRERQSLELKIKWCRKWSVNKSRGREKYYFTYFFFFIWTLPSEANLNFIKSLAFGAGRQRLGGLQGSCQGVWWATKPLLTWLFSSVHGQGASANSDQRQALRAGVRASIRTEMKPRTLAGVKLQRGCQRVWWARRIWISWLSYLAMHVGSFTKVQQRLSNKVEVSVGFKVKFGFRDKTLEHLLE